MLSRTEATKEPRPLPRLDPALADSEIVNARTSREGSSIAALGASRSSASSGPRPYLAGAT